MYILNERQEKLKNEVKAFVDREVIPAASEYDRSGVFPLPLVRRCGELGFAGEALMDGGRYNAVELCVIIEELARGSASLALALLPQYLSCDILSAAGGKAELLARGFALETLFGYAISEESGGSDVLGIDTTAIYDGGEWVLNGAKSWITNAGSAGGYIVAARTSLTGRSRNISLFYVDAAAEGLSVGSMGALLGVNSCPHGTLTFTSCRIPGESIIGAEDEGYRLLKPTLLTGRLGVAAIAVGISKRALELAAAYSTSTGKYGRNLSSYQGISFMLAEMYAKTAAAKSAVYSAAEQYMRRMPQSAVSVAAAKLMSTELACEVTKSARQVHGANGLSRAFEVERCFRDAQMLTIAEGTSEICKIIISNSITDGKELTI